MSMWQLIFLQSRVNNGVYNEESLPTQNWAWPQGTWFQKRRHYLSESERKSVLKNRPAALSNMFREVAFGEQKEARPAVFSMVPLLLAEGEISAQARKALREGRRQDAAGILIQKYGLSCGEASQLLGVAVCDQRA